VAGKRNIAVRGVSGNEQGSQRVVQLSLIYVSANMGSYPGDRGCFKATNHDHEDVMVGRMFYDANVPHTVVKDCRFHTISVR
jgi:hypothetical protein